MQSAYWLAPCFTSAFFPLSSLFMKQPHTTPDSNSAPMLSLLVPMYNESESFALFFDTVIPILQGITQEWEIVCINDGSTDDTLGLMRAKAAEDSRIRFISLSRNFGKEAALSAGLDHAFGRAVIPIDADLQDPPELIPQMVAKWREGYKVVLATRNTRDGDSWFKRYSAGVFYRLMSKLTRFNIPENTGDFRLMDQQVVQVVRMLPERSRFMKGMFAWVGFSATTVYFDRPSRARGKAKQSLGTLVRLAKDGIFSFTTLPLRLCTYLGAVISLFSFTYAAFLIIRTIVLGVQLPGYASLMVVVLCMGGIQLLSLGIIGEYIGRIYRESKQRPIYVVEETNDG